MSENIVVITINLIILAVTTWIAYKGVRSKEGLETSQEEINYQSLYNMAQKDMKEIKMENQLIKAENKKILELLDASHLEITMVVEMGKAPVVKEHKWARKEVPVV
jgi:predicted negative regulator of RcsB-dependent stress response